MRCFLNGAPALRRPWLLLITMVLGCSTASAEFTWSATAGVIGGDGSRGLHRDDLDYRGAELDARAVEKMSAGSLSVSVGVDTNLGETQGERRTTYELQEGVYVWTWNRWELAVGRQRLQWGRADGVNPTDVWTPRSYDRPTLVDAEQYRGADTVQATLLIGESGRWSALVLPHFRPSELGSGLNAELSSPLRLSEAVDAHRPGWAIRYETTGRALDYSATAVDSAELLPYFTIDADGALVARYGRFAMVGADAAYATGPWVIRGEAAWRRRERDEAHLAPATSIDAVVGVERELTEGLVANVQFLATENRGELPSTTGSTGVLGELNRGTFHQQRADYTGATASLNVRSADQRGEFNASYAIYAGGEQYLRLRGKYPLFDRFELGALFERYTGPAGSTFDRLRRNNIAWLSLSVLFGNP